MMETVMHYAVIVSAVVGALVVALNVIAPLTKTDWDNKALTALRWFQDTVLKLILPQHDVEVKKPDPTV